MTDPKIGIVVLLVLVVMVFFQVIIQNKRETKRFNKLIERIGEIEKKLENKKPDPKS